MRSLLLLAAGLWHAEPLSAQPVIPQEPAEPASVRIAHSAGMLGGIAIADSDPDTRRLRRLLRDDTYAVRPAPAGIRLKRHTRNNVIVLVGAGVVTMGVLWVMPEELSKWPKEDRRLNHFLDAYRSPPVWDQDPFFWNYIAHPLIGQWTYLMERNHGESRLRSFLFSTAASVGWEYGFEAAIEHPSAQDLLTTSPIGSLLGELSYVATRRMSRNGFNPFEKAAMVVVNPVYLVQSRGMRRPVSGF